MTMKKMTMKEMTMKMKWTGIGRTAGKGGSELKAGADGPREEAGDTAPAPPYLAQVMGHLEHCYRAPLPFDPRTGQFALVPDSDGRWAGDGDTLADFIVETVAGSFEVGGEVVPGERREVLQEAYDAMRTALGDLHAVAEGLSQLIDGEAAANPAGPPLSTTMLRQLIGAVNAVVWVAGCDHTLRHTRAYLRTNHFAVEPVVDWLRAHGGYCDCELGLNVVERLAHMGHGL